MRNLVKPADIAAGPYWQANCQRLINSDLVELGSVEGYPEIEMEIIQPMMQVYGKVHGGTIAGLMDSAIAVAVNSKITPEKGAATVELKLNYLRPVSGGKLHAQGQVVSQGKLLVVGEGRIWDDQGELVAIGTATFRIFER